ncbi:TMOD2 [Symbiodinium sp. KB8]|nr:TMOD2 [Symbiodinium sp. KB8]
MVVSTNSSARGMCAACGFQTLCSIPRAFQHPELGLVDAFSMFYDLQQKAPNKVQPADTKRLTDPKESSRPVDSAPAADVLALQVGNQAHFRPRLQTAGKLEVQPALPQGLALHPETGVIAGTPVLAVEDTRYCIKATVAEVFLKVDAHEDSQCEDVSMSINEDFATRVDCVREIEDMLPEPCKTRAYGDWMIWMVHRAWLDDPSLTDLNFGNMHMPPPHIERRIAPKLMEAMARNTHLEKLTLSNSNLLKASGVQLANALRANSSLKTLNLESNWLDSNAVRELALAIKDNLSSKIECLRFSHQKQMGQFFGRPTEEAVGQMMASNDTIVKLGFECDDAHWRNEIDRALLRNNDSWRRRQAPPDGEALPTAEERSLGRIHLVHPPDASASEVLDSYGTLCDYLDHNKKLPTTSQLQNSTRNSGQQITYAKAAPMIKELRSWMLDHSLNKLVEVLDTFETPTCGILRQWSSCHDHWIVEVWVEDRRCTFRSSREPPTSVSDDWVNWLRAKPEGSKVRQLNDGAAVHPSLAAALQQRMPDRPGGQTSALSPPNVLEPVTVEECALTFILDFEARSLNAHCVLALVGEEATPEVGLHINECLQIHDVHVEGTDLRLDFVLEKCLHTGFAALEGSQMMRVRFVHFSMQRDAGCWSDGYSFATCCYGQHRHCFDERFSFERCCLVPTAELRHELDQFRKAWLPPSTAYALERMWHGGTFSAHRRWATRRRSGLPRHKMLAVHERATNYLKQLCKPLKESVGLSEKLLPTIAKLLVHYAARVTLHDTRSLAWGLPPERVATPAAKWLSKQEARAWRRLRHSIDLARGGQYEICSCAGQGYDMLLAARDNVKRLWLHHPLFLESLVDPSQQAHHLSVMQSCVDSEEMLLALSNFVATLSKTNCAAGDVAMNIAIAQACLVQRKWARALELYLLSFALLVAAPWTDCLDQQVWDVSAEDVVYNVARIVGLMWTPVGDDALLVPAEAVSRLGWRPHPHKAHGLLFAGLLPWSRRQCNGPRTLSGACLGFGKIHVLSQDFEGASAALCSEFGAFHSNEWVNVLPEEQFPIGRGTSGELFIVPVGTPYPNLWHALHWWVPALVHKQEQGWDPKNIHVGVVFDSKPRNGQRWEVEMPGSDTERFASFHGVILRLLSSNPVRFVAHEGNMSCFAEASVGFRSFRYDLVTPQVARQDVEVFRRALQAAVGMDRRLLDPENGSFPRVLIIQRETGQPRYIVNLGHMLRVLRRGHGFVTDWQQLEKHDLLEQFSLVAQAAMLQLDSGTTF